MSKIKNKKNINIFRNTPINKSGREVVPAGKWCLYRTYNMKKKRKKIWLACCSTLNCRYRYQYKQLLNL